MSGLCISAFILAIVLALLAAMTLWPGVLLPLALAVLALLTVDGSVRRGRAFAWWALGISLGGGAMGYFETISTHAMVEHVGGSVVAALRASDKADRDRLLDAWIAPKASEGTRARIQERFDAVQRQHGAAQGGPVLPTVWAGIFPLFLPPSDVVPADDPASSDAVPMPGTALWVRVPFEKETLHLALVLGERDPQALEDAIRRLVDESDTFTRPARVLIDARFFAPRPDKR